MKMVLRLQLLDLFSRMCLFNFNIQLWSTIWKIQTKKHTKKHLSPGRGVMVFLFQKFQRKRSHLRVHIYFCI
jgi:hypothetical protein